MGDRADLAFALSGVSRIYPGSPPVPALHQFDLQVRRGEFLGVVGPSGSGKSTLLNILGLLDKPTTGTYWLNGIEVSRLREHQRSALRGAWIGFVFQTFHLLPHRTAAENVVLGVLYGRGTRREHRNAAIDVLTRVGLGHRADALPNELSGGERQRVAIARALVAAPALLLCDEPTGNLDQGTAATILGLIDDLHRSGQTVVMITHDPAVAARADRVIALLDGRLRKQEGS